MLSTEGRAGRGGGHVPRESSAAEQLLAPSVRLFAFLQSSDGRAMKSVVEDVRKHWGPGFRSVDPKALDAIETELMGASGEIETGRRWLTIAEALAGGDYAAAIEGLLAQNREVMARRGALGGSPRRQAPGESGCRRGRPADEEGASRSVGSTPTFSTLCAR